MATIMAKRDNRYRLNVIKLSLSVFLFALTYLLLLLLAIATFIACLLFGYMLIMKDGASQGSGIFASVLILIMSGYFLYIVIKFLFQKKVIDTSGYVSVSQKSEPVLFEFVDNIARSVGTDLPERIFFGTMPNASVFYDADFSSILFAPKKSLLIGISLLDSISVSEFQAILAHEFGHFSQKSMRFAAYFSVINQICYSILEENAQFQVENIRRGERTDGHKIFAILGGFAAFPMRIMYKLVRKNYLALSREMEFHADAIAGKNVDPDALASALLRLDLIDNSFNSALEVFKEHAEENRISANIFPQIKWLVNFSAKRKKCEFREGIPQVSLPIFQGMNDSKLTFEAQWHSHPSIPDRIQNLSHIAPSNLVPNHLPASTLIKNLEKLQTIATKKTYTVDTSGKVVPLTDVDFSRQFEKEALLFSFDSRFNDYFSYWTTFVASDQLDLDEVQLSPNELFSAEMLALAIENNVLCNDFTTISKIQAGEVIYKSFDYDGKQYKAKHCAQLIADLNKRLDDLNSQLENNGAAILHYYTQMAIQSGQPDLVRDAFETYTEARARNNKHFEDLMEFHFETSFIAGSDGLEDFNERELLEEKAIAFCTKIPAFKKMLKEILVDNDFQFALELDVKLKKTLSDFINKKFKIYNLEGFIPQEVKLLYDAIDACQTILQKGRMTILQTLTKAFISVEPN